MMQRDADRRKSPRARAELKVQLSPPDGAEQTPITVSTLNVSTGGVYVEVPRFIEPLTKLFLTMLVPGPTAEEEPIFVDTEAIVVRTSPESPASGIDRYEIACAYLNLSDEHRDILNRYVLTHRQKAAV
jgi:hypothetical protein